MHAANAAADGGVPVAARRYAAGRGTDAAATAVAKSGQRADRCERGGAGPHLRGDAANDAGGAGASGAGAVDCAWEVGEERALRDGDADAAGRVDTGDRSGDGGADRGADMEWRRAVGYEAAQ